jgi:hypothetical protein
MAGAEAAEADNEVVDKQENVMPPPPPPTAGEDIGDAAAPSAASE